MPVESRFNVPIVGYLYVGIKLLGVGRCEYEGGESRSGAGKFKKRRVTCGTVVVEQSQIRSSVRNCKTEPSIT